MNVTRERRVVWTGPQRDARIEQTLSYFAIRDAIDDLANRLPPNPDQLDAVAIGKLYGDAHRLVRQLDQAAIVAERCALVEGRR